MARRVAVRLGILRYSVVRSGAVWWALAWYGTVSLIKSMPFYRFFPKKSFVSFAEAKRLVNFYLLNGNLVARKENWGHDIFIAEQRVESKLHRQLKKRSISYFKRAGYRINQTPVGIKGERVLSDYFMTKDNDFYFTECLTKQMVKPTVISKKLRLAKYANLWFVVPKEANLDIFPQKENVKILIL